MRTSYAFNDVLYGLYKNMPDNTVRDMLSGLTRYEARLIRGRPLGNGKFMSTFIRMWVHSRNIRAVDTVNSIGVATVRPTMCNSNNSKKTFEYCRKTLIANHARLIRLMSGLVFKEEPEWSFPKGRASKSRVEERQLDTAIREFYEETHCDLDESFIRSRLLRNAKNEYEIIHETIETDTRIFRTNFFVFVDPRPLDPMLCDATIRLTNNTEIQTIFWRRPELFIKKWTMLGSSEHQKIKTLRSLFTLRF